MTSFSSDPWHVSTSPIRPTNPALAQEVMQVGNSPQLCRFFAFGGCTRGDDCPFSHDLTVEPKSGEDAGRGFVLVTGNVQNLKGQTQGEAAVDSNAALRSASPATAAATAAEPYAAYSNHYGNAQQRHDSPAAAPTLTPPSSFHPTPTSNTTGVPLHSNATDYYDDYHGVDMSMTDGGWGEQHPNPYQPTMKGSGGVQKPSARGYNVAAQPWSGGGGAAMDGNSVSPYGFHVDANSAQLSVGAGLAPQQQQQQRSSQVSVDPNNGMLTYAPGALSTNEFAAVQQANFVKEFQKYIQEKQEQSMAPKATGPQEMEINEMDGEPANLSAIRSPQPTKRRQYTPTGFTVSGQESEDSDTHSNSSASGVNPYARPYQPQPQPTVAVGQVRGFPGTPTAVTVGGRVVTPPQSPVEANEMVDAANVYDFSARRAQAMRPPLTTPKPSPTSAAAAAPTGSQRRTPSSIAAAAAAAAAAPSSASTSPVMHHATESPVNQVDGEDDAALPAVSERRRPPHLKAEKLGEVLQVPPSRETSPLASSVPMPPPQGAAGGSSNGGSRGTSPTFAVTNTTPSAAQFPSLGDSYSTNASGSPHVSNRQPSPTGSGSVSPDAPLSAEMHRRMRNGPVASTTSLWSKAPLAVGL